MTNNKKLREQSKNLSCESEDTFRVFFESVTDIIMVGTHDGRLLYTNAAVTKMLGYSAEELTSMHLLDLHPRDKRLEAEKIFTAMFNGERESCPLPLVHKDGRFVPVETRVWFGRWNGADCIFGISKKITAEQEAQQRFERLFRSNPALMALSTLPDRRFSDVNDVFLKLLGYSKSEVIGKTAKELNIFVHLEQQTKTANNLLKDGRIADVELQVRCKDGTIIDGIFSGEVIDSQGRKYFLTVMTDITRRKRAEEALQRQINLQNILMELASTFINIPLDVVESIIYGAMGKVAQFVEADRIYIFEYDFNKQICNNTHEWCADGIEPQISALQAVPLSAVPDWVKTHCRGEPTCVPDVSALVPGGLRDVLEPQAIKSLLTVPLMSVGECVGFIGFDSVKGYHTYSDDEQRLLFVFAQMLVNIRLRKRAEESLHQITDRLMLAVQAGGIGIWDYDVVNNKLVWDDQMYRLYGITSDQFSGAYEAWKAGLHPDDRAQGDAEIQMALRGKKDFNTEFRVLWPNGTTHSIRALALVQRDVNGQPLRMVGTNWDITSQKLSQLVLHENAFYVRQLIETSIDPLITISIDGKIMDVNIATEKITGISREKLIDSNFIDYFVEPEKARAGYLNAFKNGYIIDCPLTIRHVSGALTDVLYNVSVFRDEQGEVVGIFAVARDVNERNRSAEEMNRLFVIQRGLMLLSKEFVNVPIDRYDLVIDQSLATMGQLIDADRAYLFKYYFDSGVSCNPHEWCRQGIAPQIKNIQSLPISLFEDIEQKHRRGETVHIPIVADMQGSTALRQWLEGQGVRSFIALPLMQGDDCLGFVAFDIILKECLWGKEDVVLLSVVADIYAHFEARRIIEIKKIELQKNLIHSKDLAQEAARDKGLFLATMSHEIRTPLNAILGYAQIMERECHNCPTSKRLNVITRSGEHLLKLITDLMAMLRDDSSNMIVVSNNFDFYKLLEDLRAMFMRSIDERGLTLEISYAMNTPNFICTDQGKVRQILMNLVSNAIKFTKKGGVRLSVSVISNGTPDVVTIVVDVEDTGCGIPEKEIGRIFDLFMTTESHKIGEGIGLGLPLSRRYAQILSGDISVASSFGVGSCFQLTFNAHVVSSADKHFNSIVLRIAPNQKAYRLLLVDDDVVNNEMLAIMLTAVGFKVKTVSSAEQALYQISQTDGFDLVLMDKNMPITNGYEAIDRIRKLPDGHKLPVVIITASGFVDESEKALVAGANGYISKPIQREKLLKEIERVIGVRYIYEQEPAICAEKKPVRLDCKALSHLSVEQRHLLGQALRRGDVQQLRHTIEMIAHEHADLAAGLSVLVDAYDYDGLRRLLDSAKVETT